MLNTTAIAIIFTLSFTFPIHHMMLKFICKRKLKRSKRTEYCKIFPEVINFSPKSINAITSANTKKRVFDAIAIRVKFFESIVLRFFIFFISHLLCISEHIGKRSQNIGVITINGIPIILR
jgi:hypothetical protein